MWSIFRLQLLISVLLSSLALPTTAYPRPAATESSSVKNVVDDTAQAIHRVGVTTSVQSLESDHERATTAAAAAAATSLRPRNFPGFHEYLDIGGGWNMYYSTWPAIALPVQPAAWALSHLYASILIQARGKWSTSPPQHGFTLTYGGIRIVMSCPQRPIPWLFVGNFAEKLLEITRGGWTGVYQVMLSQAESDISIGVRLSMVPK